MFLGILKCLRIHHTRALHTFYRNTLINLPQFIIYCEYDADIWKLFKNELSVCIELQRKIYFTFGKNLVGKNFTGKNFRRQKIFVGNNFRRQKFSSLSHPKFRHFLPTIFYPMNTFPKMCNSYLFSYTYYNVSLALLSVLIHTFFIRITLSLRAS